MDRFLDWIRDLSWLDSSKIELIIKLILPYWDEIVLYTTVEGKRKEFIVYLVN